MDIGPYWRGKHFSRECTACANASNGQPRDPISWISAFHGGELGGAKTKRSNAPGQEQLYIYIFRETQGPQRFNTIARHEASNVYSNGKRMQSEPHAERVAAETSRRGSLTIYVWK